MATFLKTISGIYLAFVWLFFLIMLTIWPTPFAAASMGSGADKFMAFAIAFVVSIPAVALFAFGQVVGDVRIMRNNAQLQSGHLRAMRAYYEPDRLERVP
jgi:hypothetical protein